MRICFLSPQAYPLLANQIEKNTVVGGSEVQLVFLARELQRHSSVHVSMVTADYGQPPYEHLNGIDTYSSFKLNESRLLGLGKLLRALWSARPDVIVQRAINPMSGILALWYKMLGKRFVYMVASDYEVDGRFEKDQGRLNAWLGFLAFRFASIILNQNSFQRDQIQKRWHRESIYFPNSFPAPTSSQTVQKDIILWVGKAVPLKRPDLFLDLAEHFPNERFVMVCPAVPNNLNYFTKIQERASSLSNLQFFEAQPLASVEKLFQAAKAYVLTSDYEGFPNTFIQAAQNGVPILSVNVNPDGLLDREGLGIWCQNNSTQLPAALERILTDRELTESIAQRGPDYIQTHHSLERNAERFLELINDK